MLAFAPGFARVARWPVVEVPRLWVWLLTKLTPAADVPVEKSISAVL